MHCFSPFLVELQATEEKASTLSTKINEANSKIDQLAAALANRLEVKEKILMKVRGVCGCVI